MCIHQMPILKPNFQGLMDLHGSEGYTWEIKRGGSFYILLNVGEVKCQSIDKYYRGSS